MDKMSVTIEQVWKEYHSKLYGFIMKRVGDPSLANDLLQEVFVKTYAKIGTLKSDQKIQSWMYQIARNTIIDYYRTHKPEIEVPESLKSPADDPGDKSRREISECLLPMIRNLPPHYREAVMMADIEGLTQKEVASKQKLSLSGSKSRIQRGRALLKDMLLECCRFEFDNRGDIIEYERKRKKCDYC